MRDSKNSPKDSSLSFGIQLSSKVQSNFVFYINTWLINQQDIVNTNFNSYQIKRCLSIKGKFIAWFHASPRRIISCSFLLSTNVDIIKQKISWNNSSAKVKRHVLFEKSKGEKDKRKKTYLKIKIFGRGIFIIWYYFIIFDLLMHSPFLLLGQLKEQDYKLIISESYTALFLVFNQYEKQKQKQLKKVWHWNFNKRHILNI